MIRISRRLIRRQMGRQCDQQRATQKGLQRDALKPLELLPFQTATLKPAPRDHGEE